jgi:3',5'-cyclic AMP phosphodiesterase CpdA
MVKSLRVLQIGDLHVPEWQSSEGPIDDKDPEFSASIKGQLVEDPLRQILSRIDRITSEGQIDYVALMGDFTTKGAPEFIEPAMEVIDALTRRKDGTKIPIIGVPGNHDVEKAEAATLGEIGKFDRISHLFEKFDWAKLPVEKTQTINLTKSDGYSIPALLINTSIGSWSTHHMIPAVAEQFSNDSQMGEPPLTPNEVLPDGQTVAGERTREPVDRTEQLISQMDTPYVSSLTLSTLDDSISSFEGSSVIVIGHHNLLPQRVPRILPYGEMLNGGAVRNFLSNCSKNVIYLHGHIHEDPIENVTIPNSSERVEKNRNLIMISAPKIVDGFNELAFFYDQKEDVYLIRVTKYRKNTSNLVGNFKAQESIYIPMQTDFRELVTAKIKAVWHHIESNGPLGWGELESHFADAKFNRTPDELEDSILRLFCCNMIRVTNFGRSRRKWIMEIIG